MPKWRDVKDVTRDTCGIFQPTLISGGFPCQPFSYAGKHNGKSDDRHLWPEMFRIIRELKPRWIVAENVPGIVKLSLDEILDNLEKANYAAQTFDYSVSLIGCHERQRIFIVAHDSANGYLQTAATPLPIRKIGEAWDNGCGVFGGYVPELDRAIPKPEVCREIDGVPDRVDRLRCLGNAVVPQQVYPILKAIADIEKGGC